MNPILECMPSILLDVIHQNTLDTLATWWLDVHQYIKPTSRLKCSHMQGAHTRGMQGAWGQDPVMSPPQAM